VTTKTVSRMIADRIAAEVIEALQTAEEMHGPDLPDYVHLMDTLARLCALRAEVARVRLMRGET